MNIIRIGDKVIDIFRAQETVKNILMERAGGRTQKEVSDRLKIERSFVSHLERLGEIRRGKRVAIIGFPVGNKGEVQELAGKYGIDYVYLLSEEERLGFVKSNRGADLFNETLRVIGHLKDFDLVLFLGSDVRISTVKKIIGRDIVGIPIGKSPIKENCHVDPVMLESVISKLIGRERVEAGYQR